MNYGQLKGLCHEKGIATKTTRTDVKEGKDGFYYKEYSYTYSFDELVGRIKLRVKLDDIISFAKRNHINIREILQDIDTKKSEWQIKELTQEDMDDAQELINIIQQAILEYKPYRRYFQEILYQDTLASHLRTKLPDREVEIEKQRGSSRPDIVVDGVAIEIKGPTNKSGLISVADKCMRYKIHYPKGLIIVLFDVDTYDVNDYYYREWLEGLKRTHPGVMVIRK